MHRLQEMPNLEFMSLRAEMKQRLPELAKQQGTLFFVAYLEKCRETLDSQADLVVSVDSRSCDPVKHFADEANSLQSSFAKFVADDIPDVLACCESLPSQHRSSGKIVCRGREGRHIGDDEVKL